MLKIGICDDMLEARFTLRYTLERIFERRNIEHQIFDFSAGSRLLQWLDKHAGELDLVFLDIEMEGLDGMETAKILRASDEHLQIVFVTSHPDFVFNGYGVGALDYLLKPPAEDKLDTIVTRALTALHLAANDDYLCKNADGTYRVPKSSILYFSSERRKVTCVTKARSYTFYARLDEVEKEVGFPFVRIHQRYLVNAKAICFIGTNTVELEAVTLPVSRAYQKEAMLALTRAMLK